MNRNNEIWVFLSHSHEDYEKVRKVRDMLEDQHMRPLMFFLKCLNDHDEIDSLIKREINCRTRFILCDSENARKSDWVKEEVEYIKSLDRIYETIDLDLPIEEIKKVLSEFKRRATLFISYSRDNQNLARSVYDRLSKYDSCVFYDMEMLRTGGDFQETIVSSLNRAANDGFIIALMSERVLIPGNFSRHEIEYALYYDKNHAGKSILPFTTTKGLIDSIRSDEELKQLMQYYIRDVSEIPDKNQCDVIVNQVLIKMLTPGVILTHAHNFKNGVNCKMDLEEAEKLYALYYKLADDATNNGSDTAMRALGHCYEMGWGTSIDWKMALVCYRKTVGCKEVKEDIKRVIRKIRGEWQENL